MLRLNHPNIVRAYHCITKQLVTDSAGPPDPQPTAADAGSPQGSRGGLPSSAPWPASATVSASMHSFGLVQSSLSASQQLPQQQEQRDVGHVVTDGSSVAALHQGALRTSLEGQPQQQAAAAAVSGLAEPQQQQQQQMPPLTSPQAAGVVSSGGAAAAAGISSSRHIQDLDPDPPPAYLHRHWQQQAHAQPAGSGPSSTADGETTQAPPAPASAASTCVSRSALSSSAAGSAASRGSAVSSLAWPLIPSQDACLLSSAEGGGSDVSGTWAGADGSSSGRGRGSGLVPERPTALCETWLVMEFCDR